LGGDAGVDLLCAGPGCGDEVGTYRGGEAKGIGRGTVGGAGNISGGAEGPGSGNVGAKDRGGNAKGIGLCADGGGERCRGGSHGWGGLGGGSEAVVETRVAAGAGATPE